MIIEGLFNLVRTLLEFVFSSLSLPTLPDEIQSIIDEFTQIITSGVGIMGIFVDWDLVCILIPIVIAVVNFEKLYSFVMFILRKIPFLGIE